MIAVGKYVEWGFRRVRVIDEATDLAPIGPGRWVMLEYDGGVWVKDEGLKPWKAKRRKAKGSKR